jgi:hypothetical protein
MVLKKKGSSAAVLRFCGAAVAQEPQPGNAAPGRIFYRDRINLTF